MPNFRFLGVVFLVLVASILGYFGLFQEEQPVPEILQQVAVQKSAARPLDLLRADFGEPFIPKTRGADKAVLAEVLEQYKADPRPKSQKVELLEDFLSQHPDDPWAPSVRLNLGIYYRKSGRFTRALAKLEAVSKELEAEKDIRLKALADLAIGEYALILSHIGRLEDLEPLLKKFEDRSFRGASTELIANAHEAVSNMHSHPETSFLCGPGALRRIKRFTKSWNKTSRELLKTLPSTVRGTSLAQVNKLSKTLAMDYQMAFREPGSSILTPAVVHWKVGHFAALLDPVNGKYPVEDDTAGFGRSEIKIEAFVLDEEASGYFLVPSGPLPEGWRAVSDNEAQTVWGRGDTGASYSAGATGVDEVSVGPDAPGGAGGTGGGGGGGGSGPAAPVGSGGYYLSCGMTSWSVHAMVVSLRLTDTPVGLSPAAFAVPFTMSYAQRDIGQPAVFDYSNLGPKWTHNWSSFVTDTRDVNGKVYVYKPGGGTDEYDFGEETFAKGLHSEAVLSETGLGIDGFTLTFPDGSRDEYNQPIGNRYHLTARVTAQGNATTLGYETNGRLRQIRDSVGRVMTLGYLPSDPLKISSVTDPFGRSAIFSYTNDGHLASVRDVLGLTSAYTYGSNDFIQRLTTPYGVTSFNYGDKTTTGGTEAGRFLEAIDAEGRRHRVEAAGGSANTGTPSSEPQAPAMPIFNGLLENRNTFYWEPQQLDANPDYAKATIYHFMHEIEPENPDGEITASRVLESIKRPLQTRLWFAYPNDGLGGNSTTFLVDDAKPTHIGRVLDDGSSQVTQYEYNSIGNVTQMTDPAGRVFDYTYAPNGIDVTSASTSGETLFSATYDNNHNILTLTDAAGQTSTFTYNSRSQLETATNPLQEVTTYTYHSDANLASILEPDQKLTTFTYDSAGRVASATDSEGYTIRVDYDVFDRPTTLIYPDGTTDTLEYDRLDLVRTEDRIGRVTRMQHDALRRPTSVTDANGGVVNLTYGLEDSPRTLTDPKGNTTNFQFDLQQRLIEKTYPSGASQTIEYESCVSRVKSVTDALGQSKTYDYFIDNQLKSIDYSDADTPDVFFTQDSFLPRPLSMTDGQGVTTMTYGPIGSPGANALASISGPYGDQATFTYDVAGRPETRTVNGSVENVTFDNLWRPISTTNPLDTFQMTYLGKTGQVTQVSSNQGPTSEYTYTPNIADRRLAQIKNLRNNGTAISQFDYSYDPIGQITQMTRIHGGGDGGGGTTGTTGGGTSGTGTGGGGTSGTGTGGSGTSGDTTGTSGTGTSGTGTSGTGTSGSGTMGTSGTGTSGTGTSGTTSGTGGTGNGTGNGNGNGTGNGNGNGNNGVGNGVDPQPPGNPPINDGPGTGPGNPGNKKGKGKGSAASQMIQVIQNIWGWDTSGWDEEPETDEPEAASLAAAAITNSTETLDFRYDNLSQLVGVDINQTPHASYVFDLAGNMTSVTLNGITTTLTYNNLNQTATPGTNVFDPKGQTTEQDGRTFEWDSQGRVKAIVQGTQRSEFEYDGMSRRTAIQELEDGVVVSRKLYWWLGGAIVCERDGLQPGFPITKRYFGQGVLDETGTETTKLYYTLDHLGSVQELTDETGEVVADYRYSIYGERTKDSGDADSDFGFAGLFHHEPSGLDLATYRLYDAKQRRFISRDPLGEAVDYNLYRYAGNNPVNFRDPEGLQLVNPLSDGPQIGPADVVFTIQLIGAATGWGGIDQDPFSVNLDFPDFSSVPDAMSSSLEKGRSKLLKAAADADGVTERQDFINMMEQNLDSNPPPADKCKSPFTYGTHAQQRKKEFGLTDERVLEIIKRGKPAQSNEENPGAIVRELGKLQVVYNPATKHVMTIRRP